VGHPLSAFKQRPDSFRSRAFYFEFRHGSTALHYVSIVRLQFVRARQFHFTALPEYSILVMALVPLALGLDELSQALVDEVGAEHAILDGKLAVSDATGRSVFLSMMTDQKAGHLLCVRSRVVE
jgi:hypothetical protein